VTAHALGPADYPLGELTPDRFGTLIFLLSHATDPAAVPVRAIVYGTVGGRP
jgi:hypothetical protein